MDTLHKLIGMTFSFVVENFALTIFATVTLLLLAVWLKHGECWKDLRKSIWTGAGFFLFPVLLFSTGLILEHNDPHVAAPEWPLSFLWVIIIAQGIFSAFFIVRPPVPRIVVAALALNAALLSLPAYFIATMAITDNWL